MVIYIRKNHLTLGFGRGVFVVRRTPNTKPIICVIQGLHLTSQLLLEIARNSIPLLCCRLTPLHFKLEIDSVLCRHLFKRNT